MGAESEQEGVDFLLPKTVPGGLMSGVPDPTLSPACWAPCGKSAHHPKACVLTHGTGVETP